MRQYCHAVLGIIAKVPSAIVEAAGVIASNPWPVSTFGDFGTRSSKWQGAALSADGTLVAIPALAEAMLRIDPDPEGVEGADRVTIVELDREIIASGLHPGLQKWQGAVYAKKDGAIYGLPNYAHSVLRIDLSTNAISEVEIRGGVRGDPWMPWWGFVAASDGLMVGIPHNYGQALSVDLVTGYVTTFGDSGGHSESYLWQEGLIAGNGAIYAIPAYANKVLKIDPVARSIELFGDLPTGPTKWWGGVVTDSGSIYCVPHSAKEVLRIDPDGVNETVNDSAMTFGDLQGSFKWAGAAIAANGAVYGIPYRASAVLKIDPEFDAITLIGDVGRAAGKWFGAVLASDGTIYGIPSYATAVLRIDPTIDQVQLIDVPGDGAATDPLVGNKWWGAVLAQNGVVYAVPHNAQAVLRIDPRISVSTTTSVTSSSTTTATSVTTTTTTSSIGTTIASQECLADTGGTCSAFACHATRGNTKCVAGKCMCQAPLCSVDGRCSEKCEIDTGGTCRLACHIGFGRALCIEGLCLCEEGYCAINGTCSKAENQIYADDGTSIQFMFTWIVVSLVAVVLCAFVAVLVASRWRNVVFPADPDNEEHREKPAAMETRCCSACSSSCISGRRRCCSTCCRSCPAGTIAATIALPPRASVARSSAQGAAARAEMRRAEARGPAHAAPWGRLLADPEPEVSLVQPTNWFEAVPCRSCHDEMRENEGIRRLVPDIDRIVNEAGMKVFQLRQVLVPAQLEEDETFAIACYTFDLGTGRREGNLYFELNRQLRQRSFFARQDTMQTWGVFMHYLMSGLARLPAWRGVCYRCFQCNTALKDVYADGRQIQWGAFASAITSIDIAKMGINPAIGFLVKITATMGRAVHIYSCVPVNDEVLFSPEDRFLVERSPYKLDGYTVVDLFQVKP